MSGSFSMANELVIISNLVTWIFAALVLDFIFGDPKWLPHPVRLIARAAMALEAPMRKRFANPKTAGKVTAAVIILGTALVTTGLLWGAQKIHPQADDVLSVILLYTTFAARGLASHSYAVYKALKAGNLPLARQQVAKMVGRDTEQLDEQGIVRAAVESVAENSVDGVVAPLFFAFLLGPVGAMTYKAISTLDSTFGYKNEKYIDFGWASAKIDDLANYIPARLSLLLIPLASLFTDSSPFGAWRMCWRDSRKHASPNSGFPESAFAGALGVQLGGPLMRHGQPASTPLIGEPLQPLEQKHIIKANVLLISFTLIASIAFDAVYFLVDICVYQLF
jgi:adenosylcobinamide-phosphate synthase